MSMLSVPAPRLWALEAKEYSQGVGAHLLEARVSWRRWWVGAVLAALVAMGGAPLLAQGKGNSQKRTVGDKVRETLPPSEAVFTSGERTIILDWFRNRGSGLPPGLAKRDRLPPGLEKQLRERGTLPPGLQKKVQPLPFELERRLHRLPTGYRRVIIGRSVILMNEKTALIYDIIRSAIP